jgi:tRNA-splicing ligase RtcB (3'-phosphate/5'-hydroxy nucleic acid ligase)
MDKLQIFGQHDDATLRQIRTCLDANGAFAVLCADGHKGYSMPIGGVVAYPGQLSPSGVGYDIACGNLACRTDMKLSDVASRMHQIMDDVAAQISFGVGRNNDTPVDHELFDDDAWKLREIAGFKQKARNQLGTVGCGNHYVDIFADETDTVWVGVHFGSRGFGHGTATTFLKLAGGKDGMDVPPTLIPEESDLGQAYLQAMTLAGRYAYAGREYVGRHVAEKILGAKIVEEVHNHHNFAWKETHFGQDYWVVRKGATPAFPGQKGFVGGSMGDNAVIIEGVDSEKSKQSLYSTVHGAGRVMSRTAAKGKFVRDAGGKMQRQPGLVRHDEMVKWLAEKDVVLRGGDLDEAPQAYRRLPEVLGEHDGTIRILHTLRPLGVAMAGHDIVDPYKD